MSVDPERAAIVARIRAATPPGPAAHPGAYAAPAASAGWHEFAARLRSVGGEPLGPVERTRLAECVAARARAVGTGGRVAAPAAVADELGPGPWERVEDAADPRTLADVAVAILRGSLGVAENGAVALEGRLARVRALPFLCEHLVLLLDAEVIVPDMHEAMRRLPGDATHHHHLTWVSGPSKTADIELALVLGAHGPRSLAVVGFR